MIKKPIFRTGPLLGLRTIVLIILSLTLMTIDHQWKGFQNVRAIFSVVVLPIRYLVDWPIRFFGSIETQFISKEHLLKSNASLRARQLLLQAKLQKLLSLERENAQLRALISASSNAGNKVLGANLVAADLSPFSQQIILNKGSREGVYVGQPVVDAYGVMGQVIAVGPYSSQVLLLTDRENAVPVQDNRNGVRAIAIGLGESQLLSVIHIPDTVDIQVGDLFVTSGLVGRYPEGYPVGVVRLVEHIPGERFARIILVPKAHLNASRQLLLVWPSQNIEVEDQKIQNG